MLPVEFQIFVEYIFLSQRHVLEVLAHKLEDDQLYIVWKGLNSNLSFIFLVSGKHNMPLGGEVAKEENVFTSPHKIQRNNLVGIYKLKWEEHLLVWARLMDHCFSSSRHFSLSQVHHRHEYARVEQLSGRSKFIQEVHPAQFSFM